MKYDEITAKAGSSKKKGPAESKYLSEPGDVAGETAQKNEGAPPRKKGSAKHHGNMPKKGSGDHKEGHKGGAKKDIMLDEKMPPPRKKGGAKHHGNMPKKKGSGDHKDGHKGSANYKEGYPPAGSGKKKGASKKKGSADFKGGLHAKNTKHSESGEHLGAKKAGAAMGFTQNFGPARQNSYARGAAKVAKIMASLMTNNV